MTITFENSFIDLFISALGAAGDIAGGRHSGTHTVSWPRRTDPATYNKQYSSHVCTTRLDYLGWITIGCNKLLLNFAVPTEMS